MERRVFLPCWRSCRNSCPSSLRCRSKAHSYTMNSATTISEGSKRRIVERNIEEDRSKVTMTTAAIKKLWQEEIWRGVDKQFPQGLAPDHNIETLLFHAAFNLASFCQSAPQYHGSACWDGTNIHALSRYPPWPRKRGKFFSMLPNTTEPVPVGPAVSWLYFVMRANISRSVPVHRAMSSLHVDVAKYADVKHRMAPTCLK